MYKDRRSAYAKDKIKKTLEFGSRCDFAIMDLTDLSAGSKAEGKKRGTITVDYAPSDVKQLINRGHDLQGAMEYYQQRIYKLVKHYISDDWEYADGGEEALAIIKNHIRSQF